MKKQYKKQKYNTIQPEPQKEEPVVIDTPQKVTSHQKSLLTKIKKDHAFPFFVCVVLFAIIIISYTLIVTHHEIDKAITLKVVTTSSGAYVEDECRDIYLYSPVGFGSFEPGKTYKANMIKYPFYGTFLQNGQKTLMNFIQINESEYIKNC